jgi:methionyl-tRNA formyltransferase
VAHPAAQPAAGACYAPKIGKSDAVIRWGEPAPAIARAIRAYNPWPVAHTSLDGQLLRCWAGEPLAGEATALGPGSITDAGAAGIDVQTGTGLLRLTSVQLAGRSRVSGGEFANGYPLRGKVLGA